MTKNEKLLKCDWCGVEERIPYDAATRSTWARMQVYQLVHSEPAVTWELCPYCWSVVESRRCGIRTDAIMEGRHEKPEGPVWTRDALPPRVLSAERSKP